MFHNITHMFKGISGNPEMGRVLWFLGGLATIAYQGYALHLGQVFDPLTFSGGFAALLAAGGFGISQKDGGVAKAQAAIAPTIQVEQVTGDINSENTNVARSGS